ncbi:MAG: NifB/NifX family molybdenum-iron cluster-binding protein [Smithellaceae bacterium]|nr:NifB/NifX family molybdenum-iron cluster-binding protein [Smithellaceae bacterium]
MKIALSIFKDSISTVFDAADQLLILETDGTNGQKRTMIRMGTTEPANRATHLREQGINVLICGAISWPLQTSIASMGITVYPFVRGTVEEIIAAYHDGRLNSEDFAMPGCIGRCQGSGMGRGQGRRCRRQKAGVPHETSARGRIKKSSFNGLT